MKTNDLLILGAIGAFILLRGNRGGPEELGGGGSAIQVLGSPVEQGSRALDEVVTGTPLGEGPVYVAGFQQDNFSAVKTDFSQLSDPHQYAQYGGGLILDKTSGLIKFVGGGFAGFAGKNVPLSQTPGQKTGELIPATFEDPLVLKQTVANAKNKSQKSKSVPKKNASGPVINYTSAKNYTPAKVPIGQKIDGSFIYG